jgi:alpha,alpha-trehalase
VAGAAAVRIRPVSRRRLAADPPQVLFQDLFSAVQSSHIYPDGKAFPDAVPNAAPKDILAQYHAEKPGSPAALKQFVESHFTLPSEVIGAPSPPDRVAIVAHIDGLWNGLTRSSITRLILRC